MSLEADVRRLVTHRDILDLKYRYCWAIDENDVSTFVSLFTEDAILTASHIGESEPYMRCEGREELRALVHQRQEELDRSLGQHRPYNPIIDVDEDEATGKWYFTSVAREGDGTVEFEFGEYHEVYRRVDGQWLLAECHIEYMEIEPELVR
jgi:ketosteroid isomerase-like protein